MTERGSAGARCEVVTLGESMVAFVAAELGPLAEVAAFSRHVAGAEANAAVGLTRLGHRTAFIGRVGSDGLGTAIVRGLRGAGVVVDWLSVDPGAPTGLLVRERRAFGPADVLYRRAQSAGSRLDPVDVDTAAAAGVFDGARWLHLTGITPALSATCRAAVERAIEHARTNGLTVSLDINLRRKLWSDEQARPVLADLSSRSDLVLAGADEAAVVTGKPIGTPPDELARAVLALGPSLAVVKLGANGAIAIERGGHPVQRPALPLVPVDPVGAGDAFSAGFIAARLEGSDLTRVLDVANACGAAAVAAIGDQAGLLDRSELDGLLGGLHGDAIR